MKKALGGSLSLRAERSNLKQNDEFFYLLRRRLPRPFGPHNDVCEGFHLYVTLMCLIVALLPLTVRAQDRQWLQYQSANITLAAAQDTPAVNTQADSDTQERDRAVGMTSLFLIVVVIAVGVLFAIIMVTGHGGRQST